MLIIFWAVVITHAMSVLHENSTTSIATKNQVSLQSLYDFANKSRVINVTSHDLSNQNEIFPSFPGTFIKRRVIGITSTNDFSEMMADDADLDGNKYGFFVALHKLRRHVYWYSGILQEGACSGLFPVTANSIYWKVRGKPCGFVLFEDGNCRGNIALDNREYNIVQDGFRDHVLFRSVYYECR